MGYSESENESDSSSNTNSDNAGRSKKITRAVNTRSREPVTNTNDTQSKSLNNVDKRAREIELLLRVILIFLMKIRVKPG